MNITANEVLARLVREREVIAGIMEEELEPLKQKAKQMAEPHRERIKKLNDRIKRVLGDDGGQLYSEELIKDYFGKDGLEAIKAEQQELIEQV